MNEKSVIGSIISAVPIIGFLIYYFIKKKDTDGAIKKFTDAICTKQITIIKTMIDQ